MAGPGLSLIADQDSLRRKGNKVKPEAPDAEAREGQRARTEHEAAAKVTAILERCAHLVGWTLRM